MKSTFWAALACFLVLFSSCGDKNETKNSSLVLGNSTESESSIPEKVSNKAVLLWNSGIIDSPSKEGKWKASYQFGNQLTLTGSEKTVDEEKKTYIEVTGPDGKTGWINSYLIEKNAIVAVCLSDITLYKNPDVMSISSDVVKAATIVAVSAEGNNDFFQIIGKEKKVKGYINNTTQLSSEAVDLKVAVLLDKSKGLAGLERINAMKALLDDPSNAGSKLLGIVESLVQSLEPKVQSITVDSI